MRFYILALMLLVSSLHAASLTNTGTQWYPFLEWPVTNTSYQGNPYDLEATAKFTHPGGEVRTTGLFYAGSNTWRFRFTGTRTGVWSFVTSSEDPELNGITGKVTINPNPNPKAKGFHARFGNKWGWEIDKAFVPQIVMYNELPGFANKPDKIDADIKIYFKDHGFNGLHIGVLSRWFSFEHDRYDEIKSEDPNPDSRTFEALELLITKAHHAGGMVHIWAWGDEQRHMTPKKWGINGKVDKRLQRYIAARLGPLPGWSMGYGFDLDEWVEEKQLQEWHSYMQKHMGWFHLLGARSGGPNSGTDHTGQIMGETLDYTGYEHHRPTYEVYLAAMRANPNKPVFSEDRFRVRKPSPYPEKDYDELLTRRGFWHSTMAGGVANIWGNMTNPQGIYANKEALRTWARFFDNRFLKNFSPSNNNKTLILKTPNFSHSIFYMEDTDTIDVTAPHFASAVAIDCAKDYQELKVDQKVWKAPYKSDWAIAVGNFR